MNLRKMLVCALGCAMLMLCAFGAVAEEAAKDQVRCYTTWDDSYLYLAFKVDCPDVGGTHTAPNADVTGDDAISVFIETDNKHSIEITPKCMAMNVSAAGGAQFLAGTDKGKLAPSAVYSFKYGPGVQGTINNSDDIDMGYSIEVAIPWDIMKTQAPKLGDMMSFNVLVRRHGGKPDDFVSASPRVKTEADVNNPAKWANLVFANYSFSGATLSLDKIVSMRYVVRPPLINGSVSEKEWQKNTSFAMDIPVPAGFVYEAKFPTQRLVLTEYFYWYQADSRKGIPTSQILRPDGGMLLQDFPAKNAGPWFSYDRVQWHKEELSDMVSAGIDVVLPVYWGDRVNRAGFAAKGLDCMVSAIQELQAEGKPYPLVGMFLDTYSFEAAYKQKPDLRTDEVKRSLYGMIKDFFDRVPPEYRAIAQAGKPQAGEAGNIVFLHGSGHFSGLDSTFVAYCNESFAKDFGSALVWIGSEDYKGKVQGFDGYTTHGAAAELRYDNSGRIAVASVGPGYDNSASMLDGPPLVISRMGGETYGKDWAGVVEKVPQWVVCDSWNGFPVGSDICASREYGRKYIDLTRSNVKRYHGNADFDARFIRYNVPKMISSKQFAQAEFVIRNVGASPWRLSDGYALAYRWYKNGRYYGESKVRRPLERDVQPGETITVTIGIATVTAQNAPMPDGACELRVELIRLSDNKWFSLLGDQPLMVPLVIGQTPDWSATYLSSDVPVMLATGRSRSVTIRLRNDGAQLWRKGTVKLACKLYRVSNYAHESPMETAEEVPIKDARAVLAKDCKPGEMAQFVLALDLTGPDKKPVPAWQQDDTWSYQLRFDLYNGVKWLSELGSTVASRNIDVFNSDFGARIVDSDVPAKLTAGQTLEAKVVLKNTGDQVWDRKRTKIGYHWYYLDGTEMQWDGVISTLKTNLKPGTPVVTNATVKVPEYDGQYVLVWDVMTDDKWLSAQPLSRGGDILPVFVEVTGGKLVFAELTRDLDAISSNAGPNAGDFDGKGSSFPAECMPPDAGVRDEICHVYPAGYNCDRADRSASSISFYYPGKSSDAATAVTCNAQKVTIENDSYVAMHILGASSSGDASGQLSLNYGNGATPAALQMSDWGTGPKHGEKIGYMARHRHSQAGDETGKNCYLYHYVVPLDASRDLTSITLPANPNMKIMSMTLERKSIPVPPTPAPAPKK